MRRPDNTNQAAAAAVQATAATASSTTAVPNTTAGTKARRVALKVVTATEIMYFRVGQSTAVAAVATGYPLQASDGWLIVSTAGMSHIAAIRGGSVDVVFNIIPLED